MLKNALRGDPEQQMLDEIEASTNRTYQLVRVNLFRLLFVFLQFVVFISTVQSLKLHDEVTHQTKYVEMMEERFDGSKGALKQETKNINETRKMGQEFCWMYGVIAAEVVVFFLLLYVGLR